MYVYIFASLGNHMRLTFAHTYTDCINFKQTDFLESLLPITYFLGTYLKTKSKCSDIDSIFSKYNQMENVLKHTT